MRSRSHRSNDTKDDWVDGSWTVDCVCGVNFDDGEEMVDCDECGVWVHTRCSRYIKSEKSFACDKCKSKNNSSSRNNDSEETEVAQLLVELPMKTMKMDSMNHRRTTSSDPPRRPFRLWTEIPMEERVHVQGIPGGDPTLFEDVPKSSIFTPELWKCTGYVAKKFNFQYREFPCWDKNEDVGTKIDQDTENPVDKGANVLFSLSKETMLDSHVDTLVGMKGKSEEANGDKELSFKKRKTWDGERYDTRISQKHSKKERSLLRSSVIHSGKKKKEDLAISKDRSGKRRARELVKEGNIKNRGVLSSKLVRPSNDVKESESNGEKVHELKKNDNQSIISAKLRNTMSQETISGGQEVVVNNLENKLVADSHTSDALDCKMTRHDVAGPGMKHDGSNSLMEEVNMSFDNIGSNGACLSTTVESQKSQPLDVVVTAPKVEDSDDVISQSQSLKPIAKVEIEVGDNKSIADLKQSSPLTEKRGGPKINDCLTNKLDDLSGDHYQPNEELKDVDGFMTMPNSSLEPNHDSIEAEDQSISHKLILNQPPTSSQHKMLADVEKSLSPSTTNLMSSKSDISNSGKAENNQTPNPIAKPQVPNIKQDSFAIDVVNDRNGHELPVKCVKERSKSSSLHGRTSCSSGSRHTSSDSKNPVVYTSSKASSAQNAGTGIGSSESSGRNKSTSSGSLQRGETFNHSIGQPSSKNNLTPATHGPAPSNARATLSDEELALLLHQELNSSPRVPRVPRGRQGGNLPQLGSPTSTSNLKRNSCFGGKDHNSVSRKKVNDSKSRSPNVHELDDEVKKTNKVPSSLDHRRHDSGNAIDGSTRNESVNGSPEEGNFEKRNIRTVTSVAANSGRSSSSEATGQNSSSVRNSPRNISDDDTGTVGGPVHRTLPGLLSEIMSKGQRMTYDELCDAVLPHWNNLRKHNGERYAYSSHFQAVLDCLRNRTEWAQLVDRGPKTNASRKKRKNDSEQLSSDSEDKDTETRKPKMMGNKSMKPHQKEFPKGKRNARKRRRLALQGRGIKDVRKRRKSDLLTDDDYSAFSNSSDESVFSEDETCAAENEASVSSELSSMV